MNQSQEEKSFKSCPSYNLKDQGGADLEEAGKIELRPKATELHSLIFMIKILRPQCMGPLKKPCLMALENLSLTPLSNQRQLIFNQSIQSLILLFQK